MKSSSLMHGLSVSLQWNLTLEIGFVSYFYPVQPLSLLHLLVELLGLFRCLYLCFWRDGKKTQITKENPPILIKLTDFVEI